MTTETEMNENLLCLLEHAFPKGDKRRGDALVIVAQAQIEIDKARQQGAKAERERLLNEIDRQSNLNITDKDWKVSKNEAFKWLKRIAEQLRKEKGEGK